MTKTVKDMLNEAFEKVPMVEPTEAIKLIDDQDTVFVDVRDKDSVINSGKIKGAIHAERGLLEFYADQEHDMGIDEISPMLIVSGRWLGVMIILSIICRHQLSLGFQFFKSH